MTSFDRLMGGPETHPGKKHFAPLLDQFDLIGPNGRHLCLVSDAFDPTAIEGKIRPDITWNFIKQIVEATAYAHELGVVHGGEPTNKSAI